MVSICKDLVETPMLAADAAALADGRWEKLTDSGLSISGRTPK